MMDKFIFNRHYGLYERPLCDDVQHRHAIRFPKPAVGDEST